MRYMLDDIEQPFAGRKLPAADGEDSVIYWVPG
jgi:hypothetical protein